MRFIQLHDGDGLAVLVNLGQVEAILELEDGFCCIVFVGRRNRKKTLSFYPMETYAQVLRKIDFGVEIPSQKVSSKVEKEFNNTKRSLSERSFDFFTYSKGFDAGLECALVKSDSELHEIFTMKNDKGLSDSDFENFKRLYDFIVEQQREMGKRP